MRNFLLQLLLLFILISCVEKVRDDEFPEPSGKLIISCIISPEEEIISAGLSRTFPSELSDSYSISQYLLNADPLNKAVVYISDGTSRLQLPYNSFSGKDFVFSTYSYDFSIRPGKSYRLDVITEQGEHAWATCTVPDTINRSIEFVIPGQIEIIEKEEDGHLNYNYEIKDSEILAVWEDLPGKQYYSIDASLYETDYNGKSDFSSSVKFFPYTVIEDGGIFKAADGKSYVPGILVPVDTTIDTPNVGTIFDILFYTGDENFGKYFSTLDDIVYPGPFDEPFRQFSNINGAMGIFAACRKFHTNSYINSDYY
jgi:hypothetical protein